VTPDDGTLAFDEGIHIGYRAWLRAGSVASYRLGSGLGYTRWRFDDVVVAGDLAADDAQVVVRIANTGDRAGKHVVQVYAERPDSEVDRPARWLVGFAPVRADAGTGAEVTIPLPARAFAHWDSGWQYEPGEFRLRIGSSVVDLPLEVDVRVARPAHQTP
jgi:beta-glucosidase